MSNNEQPERADETAVQAIDFAGKHDMEDAQGSGTPYGGGSPELHADRQMNRTVSFQDGHYVPESERQRHRRWRRRRGHGKDRSTSVSSIGATDEEDLGGSGSDDDGDDTVDDGERSTTFTATSEGSDGEPEEEDQAPVARGRFTPGFIARGRARRRARTLAGQEEGRTDEKVGGSVTVYRRMPVLTGVVAPFSIMLEIPGFTSRWYVRLDPMQDLMVYRPNPPILDVGLAFSLASAVIANIAILGRFSERISPRRATLTAGICFIVHDTINVIALVAFGLIHAVDDGFTYSEAYWMTTAATCASLVCTLSLLIDYFGTKNFGNAGSGLTPKQAQLVMVIMAFLAYISISAMIYALIMPLAFLDAMYFMVESLATVGLGDITPKNLASRVVLFFVAPVGIVLLAVVVVISRQTIIEEFENAYKRRRALYKKKAAERQEERRKNRELRVKLKRGRRHGRGGSTALSMFPASADGPGKDSALSFGRQASKATRSGWLNGSLTTGFSRSAGERSSEPVLDEKDRFRMSPQTSTIDLVNAESGLGLHRTDTMATTATTVTTASQLREYEAVLVTQRQDIEQNFGKFRKELARAERNEFWIKLGVAASLLACFWVVGASIFSAIEGWSFFEGFYFVFVIFTSIGYGDFAPKTSSGRAFFVVWALLGVGTLTILFSVLSDAWANRMQQRKLAGRKLKRQKRLSRLGQRFRAHRAERARAQHEQQGDEGRADAEKNSEESIVAKDGPPSTDDGAVNGGAQLNAGHNEKEERGSASAEPSSESHSLQEEDEDVLVRDAGQLHLDFTATAMDFHKSALDFMNHNRSSIVETFRNVPELAEITRRMDGQGMSETERQQVTEQDRNRLLDAVRRVGDANALFATHQWLLIHDFERTLHSLVNKSAAFQRANGEANSRTESVAGVEADPPAEDKTDSVESGAERTTEAVKNAQTASMQAQPVQQAQPSAP